MTSLGFKFFISFLVFCCRHYLNLQYRFQILIYFQFLNPSVVKEYHSLPHCEAEKDNSTNNVLHVFLSNSNQDQCATNQDGLNHLILPLIKVCENLRLAGTILLMRITFKIHFLNLDRLLDLPR